MIDVPVYDFAVLVWLLAVWSGYTVFADRYRQDGYSLMSVMKTHRAGWMRQMLSRENRVVDSTIMGALMRSVGLFSSITLLILAGLLAIMGSLDKVQALAEVVPYLGAGSKTAWEMKVLVLILIFIYAFFKCAWSLRQFNYSIILLGGAPPITDAQTPYAQAYAERMGEVIALATTNFNRAMRAYYYGLAALSWFLHPALFVVATLWVTAVIYRREFRSQTLKNLHAIPEPEEAP